MGAPPRRTLRTWAYALWVVLLGLWPLGRAAGFEAPRTVSADPGAVVALALRVPGAGTLSIAPPEGAVTLGHSDVVAGPVLATLLLGPTMLAGEYELGVTFTPEGPGAPVTATVRLHVNPRPAVDLSYASDTVLRVGASTPITVSVTNRGNVTDVYSFEAAGQDQLALTPTRAEVAPGATETVAIRVTPRSLGRHGLTFKVTSGVDPAVRKAVVIRYSVLAFGAEDLSTPFLQFALPLGASYGTDGFDYQAGVRVSGPLSDFVDATGYLSTAPSAFRTSVGLLGDDWDALYGYDSGTGHHLSVGYAGARLFGSLDPTGHVTTGLGYARGPWTVTYSHRWGPGAVDTALAGYTVAITPALSSTVSLGATGEVQDDGTYRASPLAAASVRWAVPTVGVNVSGRAAPWSDRPWSVSAHLYSRRSTPVAYSVSANLSPTQAAVEASALERLSSELTLGQTVAFSRPDATTVQFAARYAPIDSPVSLAALIDGSYTGGVLMTREALSATITRLPWIASTRLRVDRFATMSYGQTYLGPSYSVGGSIDLPLTSPFAAHLGLRASTVVGPVRLGAGVTYHAEDDLVGGSVLLGLAVTPDVGLTGEAEYDARSGLTWKIGATATLLTGVAVPEDASSFFGGRDVGTIAGTVTARAQDGTTRPVGGVTVLASPGHTAARTGVDGTFEIALPPGSYTLAFLELPAYLVPPDPPTVTVSLHETVRLDVEMPVSYAVTGQVVAGPSNAVEPSTPSGGATGVHNVRVRLSAGASNSRYATTDRTGSFAFTDVAPGAYEVAIVPDTLPPDYAASAASTRQITVGGDTQTFVILTARQVPRPVINTLGTQTFPLDVRFQPGTAPPGAIVTVTARSESAERVEAEVLGGEPVPLRRVDARTFTGDVTVPADSRGVATLRVRAVAGERHAEVTRMIFVEPGPLASLKLSETHVPPGRTVHVTVRLLVDTSDVVLLADGVPIPITETGPRILEAALAAPTSERTVAIELKVNGKRQAATTLTVTAGP